MSDPNPYTPPQVPDPLTQAQAIKRGIGVGVILVLTPLAVSISIVAGCTASGFLPSVSHPLWNDLIRYSAIVLVPLVTLVGMMVWAVVADHRREVDPARRKARTWRLMLTPVVVAGATVLGIGLTIVVVDVTSRNAGGVTNVGVLAGLAFFALTPTIALFTMLAIAWRAGR